MQRSSTPLTQQEALDTAQVLDHPGILEGRGHDVLGQAVELVAVLAA
jgi:hypothetical protein